MPTKVEVPDPFLKALKHLTRKYPAVLKEFESLTTQLKNDARPGDRVPVTKIPPTTKPNPIFKVKHN